MSTLYKEPNVSEESKNQSYPLEIEQKFLEIMKVFPDFPFFKEHFCIHEGYWCIDEGHLSNILLLYNAFLLGEKEKFEKLIKEEGYLIKKDKATCDTLGDVGKKVKTAFELLRTAEKDYSKVKDNKKDPQYSRLRELYFLEEGRHQTAQKNGHIFRSLLEKRANSKKIIREYEMKLDTEYSEQAIAGKIMKLQEGLQGIRVQVSQDSSVDKGSTFSKKFNLKVATIVLGSLMTGVVFKECSSPHDLNVPEHSENGDQQFITSIERQKASISQKCLINLQQHGNMMRFEQELMNELQHLNSQFPTQIESIRKVSSNHSQPQNVFLQYKIGLGPTQSLYTTIFNGDIVGSMVIFYSQWVLNNGINSGVTESVRNFYTQPPGAGISEEVLKQDIKEKLVPLDIMVSRSASWDMKIDELRIERIGKIAFVRVPYIAYGYPGVFTLDVIIPSDATSHIPR